MPPVRKSRPCEGMPKLQTRFVLVRKMSATIQRWYNVPHGGQQNFVSEVGNRNVSPYIQFERRIQYETAPRPGDYAEVCVVHGT